MMVMVPLLQGVTKLLVLPVYVLLFLGLWDPLWKKLFPYFMIKFSRLYHQQLHKEKQQLFSNLADFTGSSGSLSLLEIGMGTGANFQFYPFGCRVTGTDPNPNVEKYLLKNIAENQHLRFEGFILASGEDLHQVLDSSVDMVVGTLVLCYVADVRVVLKEVLRVLRPVSKEE